ncbi:hypothetical protein B0H19DRAFT_1062827 [Mycena capillaripes]|nr:hypothetical protein B0H19DRAFT_1062827 [Mycena capillaripes]
MDKKTEITGLSKLNKKQKAEVVFVAIESWMARVNAGEVPLNGNQLPEPLECEESVVESEEDEEDNHFGDLDWRWAVGPSGTRVWSTREAGCQSPVLGIATSVTRLMLFRGTYTYCVREGRGEGGSKENGRKMTLKDMFPTRILYVIDTKHPHLGGKTEYKTESKNKFLELGTPIAPIGPSSDMIHAVSSDPDVRSLSASTRTRRQFEAELIAVQKKIVNIEDSERTSVGSNLSGGELPGVCSGKPAKRRRGGVQGVSTGPSRIWRQISMRYTSPDVEAQLQAFRDQINMLVRRINALEAHADSWGVGRSGETLPEYV